MVASAGNNGESLEYPARFPGVIAVGALDQNGRLAEFSSRGKGLNKNAPGVSILSTWTNKGFKTLDGTSMAAPHITGLEALRLSQKLNSFRSRLASIMRCRAVKLVVLFYLFFRSKK